MTRIFFANLIHFKNVSSELTMFSLYPNNLIQANINVPILDYISGGVPLFNNGMVIDNNFDCCLKC